MKSRKFWVGIPVIVLVFAVVFGVMFTSCEEPITEDDLIGVWYSSSTAANNGDGKPSFEFKSGELLLGGDTFSYKKGAGQNVYEFTTKAGATRGSAKFAMEPNNSYQLTVSQSNSPINNGTYYKPGYSGDGGGSTNPEVTLVTISASLPGGFYETTQTVTLTASSGATIRYTTDNSDPKNASGGNQSPVQVTISSSVMLRAIAFQTVESTVVYSNEFVDNYIITTATGGGTQVTSGEDSGDNTLRAALTSVNNGGKITIDSSVTTIALTQCLDIDKDVIIEGNGVTITRKDGKDLISANKSLINIREGKTVSISGVRFSNGNEKTGGLGGAIYNIGTLTLESCIFDGNKANYGGAVYSTAKSPSTTVKGCTFYKNEVSKWGGALFIGGGTLFLTGNLFYLNTATDYGPVVDHNDSTNAMVISKGYNVVDKDFGGARNSCGWANTTGNDKKFSDVNISSDPFDTTSFLPVAGLKNLIPNTVVDFPSKDINGATRNGTPGAVNAN